jgi:hypothetical protein
MDRELLDADWDDKFTKHASQHPSLVVSRRQGAGTRAPTGC